MWAEAGGRRTRAVTDGLSDRVSDTPAGVASSRGPSGRRGYRPAALNKAAVGRPPAARPGYTSRKNRKFRKDKFDT